jgi:hypothetical protein
MKTGTAKHASKSSGTPPSGRTRAAAKGRKARAAASPKGPAARRPAAGAVAPPRPAAGDLGDALSVIRHDLAAIRGLLASGAATFGGAAADADEADAVRRLLGDQIDRRLETVARALVEIRLDADALGTPEAARLVESLDRLLDSLGTVRFEAERLDHVDPLIHAVAREQQHADLPDGVVLETLRPGCRSGRGAILARALVAVNRRP